MSDMDWIDADATPIGERRARRSDPPRCSVCFSTEHLASQHDLPPWLHKDLRDRSGR